MRLEQKSKDKRLEELEKSLQAQIQAQQNQQKILETIWNNMVSSSAATTSNSKEDEKKKEKKKNNQHHYKDDVNNENENNNIHISKLSLTWQKRGEQEKEPPPITTAAETFVLADGKNNKLAKDMSPEEIGQLPWRTLASKEELRKRLS
jgi:hypothetical protein